MFEHFFADEATKPPSPDVLLRDYGRVAFAPGSCYEYSNIGYSALGAVAEISGVLGLGKGDFPEGLCAVVLLDKLDGVSGNSFKSDQPRNDTGRDLTATPISHDDDRADQQVAI